jgi:hypothetical protein
MIIRKNRILKNCKVKIRRVAHEREKNPHSSHHCGAMLSAIGVGLYNNKKNIRVAETILLCCLNITGKWVLFSPWSLKYWMEHFSFFGFWKSTFWTDKMRKDVRADQK